MDINVFDAAMKNLGYNSVSKSFLVKKFDDIEINITRRNGQVESITGYKNNEVVKIPTDILNQVQQDIQQSL
jgi:hypothetical protein